jgi:hypothetical protein
LIFLCLQNLSGRPGRYGTGQKQQNRYSDRQTDQYETGQNRYSDGRANQYGTGQKRSANGLAGQYGTGQNHHSDGRAGQYGTGQTRSADGRAGQYGTGQQLDRYSDPLRSSAVNPFVRDKEWKKHNFFVHNFCFNELFGLQKFSDLKCEILAQCLAVLCTVRQVHKY